MENVSKQMKIQSPLDDQVEEYEVEPSHIDVRQIREALGLTQIEFASQFGIALGSIRNWEQNRSEPDATTRSFLIVVKNNPLDSSFKCNV
jgi:putative transcriptional regulator